jgi:hypothetical protein
MKIGIVGLTTVMICLFAYLTYDYFTQNREAISEEDRAALKEEFTQKHELYLDSIRSIVILEESLLARFEEEVTAAKRKSINPSVTKAADNFSIEFRKYLDEAKYLLDPRRELGGMIIDTSSIVLPAIKILEDLLKSPLLELRRELDDKRKKINEHKETIATAVDEQTNQEEENKRQAIFRKKNAKKATSIADESELYSSKVYDRYISWTVPKNTRKTDLIGSERKRVHNKLKLLRDIARLEYYARVNFDDKVIIWLSQLKEKSTHPSLNAKQKQMLKQKFKSIMSSSR